MKNAQKLETTAHGLFANFCNNLAQIDLRTAIAVPAVIGVVTAMYGIGLEVHGQSQLLQEGGALAVRAYKASMQVAPVDSILEYSKLAFEGKLKSFGGNAQGVGVTLTYLGPAVAAATVTLARGFGKVKDFLSEKFWQANAKQLDDDLFYAPERVISSLHNSTINANHKHHGVPLLSVALSNNNLDLAKALIDAGANVNAYADRPAIERGMAPIHFARSVAAVELLARAQAHIDAPHKQVDHAWAMRGETALHSASLNHSREGLALAEALIRAGADTKLPFANREYQYDRESITPINDRVVRGGLSIEERLAKTQVVFGDQKTLGATVTSIFAGSMALQAVDDRKGPSFYAEGRERGLPGQDGDEPTSGLRMR